MGNKEEIETNKKQMDKVINSSMPLWMKNNFLDAKDKRNSKIEKHEKSI